MVRLGLVLALYASVSCAVLAAVNGFTAPKIAKNQEVKIASSMKEFFPDEDCVFEGVSDYDSKTSGSTSVESLILAKKNGVLAGGAVQVSGPTYDRAKILVGMTVDGTVTGVKFIELSDSPGFGLKANDPTFVLPGGKTFYGQFEGLSARDGFYTDRNFDGISGATITSDGIAVLLTEGTRVLFDYFSGLENSAVEGVKDGL